MNITAERTIGQIVAEDYRTAAVFEAFRIDFCCNGNKTIHEACEDKRVHETILLQDLEKIKSAGLPIPVDYNSLPLDLLTDYIEKVHHRYVESKTPVLQQYLEKICMVHGKRHPESFQIKDLFNHSTNELAAHMKKEELILFPFIQKLSIAYQENKPGSLSSSGIVQNAIKNLIQEHDSEGDILRKISELSNNYNTPPDACNTYKVTFSLLKDFELDLHLHLHLENNILFPKAIEMEKQMKKFYN